MRFRELTEIEGKDFYNFVLSNLPEKLSKEDGNHFLQFRVLKPIEVVAADRRIMANEIRVPLLIRNGHIAGKAIAMRDYDSETGLVAQEVSVLFDAPIGPIKTDWAFAFADDKFSINLLKVDWPGNHPDGVSSITCRSFEEPIPPPS